MRTLHGIVERFYSSMVKVKSGAKVITIEPAQDAYGNISIVKPVFKVITIEPSADALSVEESLTL
jgi:hypothetical protein